MIDRLKISPIQSDVINLLRAIAAQCVLIGHLEFTFFGELTIINHVAKPAFAIFIVLSGYLISFTTFRKINLNQNYGFLNFLIERFARIYIAFIPALLIGALADHINFNLFNKYSDIYSLKNWLINIFQLQDQPIIELTKKCLNINTSLGKSLGSNGPLWSLSFEWWLYLIFGWTILIDNKRKWWFWTVFILLAVNPIYRIFYPPTWINHIVLMWLIGLIITVAIKNGGFDNPNKKDKYYVTISIIGLFISSFYSHILSVTIFIGFSLFFGFKILNQTTFTISKKTSETIKFLNNFSFTLYLIHYPILMLFRNLFQTPNYTEVIITILSINFIAICTAYVFEMRYKKVSNYLFKKLKLS